jgi:hypothetical protein
MVGWFLSRRDSTIVAWHEVLCSGAVISIGVVVRFIGFAR